MSGEMPSKAERITGWVLTALVGLFLIGASGVPKFIDFPGKKEMMEHLGLPLAIVPLIGAIEVTVTLLYLIPRTSFLGAILTTGYLGGAVVTHLRVNDGVFEILFPVMLGIFLWTSLALRRPMLWTFILGFEKRT